MYLCIRIAIDQPSHIAGFGSCCGGRDGWRLDDDVNNIEFDRASQLAKSPTSTRDVVLPDGGRCFDVDRVILLGASRADDGLVQCANNRGRHHIGNGRDKSTFSLERDPL